ncbi:hypothetical protein ACH4U7_21920 [Streptomyces sp. NPDC020845]|uniref:IS1096 element passenger TnpR family protein n=1 Tax=Streptomyces sp. NPDC020845 TaxID=3365096 RepID=UPI003796E377
MSIAKVPLCAVAPAVGDKISYTYDFGDGWVHRIEVKKALQHQQTPCRLMAIGGTSAAQH